MRIIFYGFAEKGRISDPAAALAAELRTIRPNRVFPYKLFRRKVFVDRVNELVRVNAVNHAGFGNCLAS